MVKASIDIGTNTLLMLIQLENQEFINVHRIARLGEKLHSTGYISEAAIQRASTILSEYYQLLRSYGNYSLRVVGTAALRIAKNSQEVCSTLSTFIHAPIEVISGEEEATYTFLGTIETEEPSVVIDIGGGSTEIVVGSSKRGIEWRNSFPLGAVTCTEQFQNTEEKYSMIKEKVFTELQLIPLEIKNMILSAKYIYANAGTPTSIAAVAQNLETFDESKVHNFEILSDTLFTLEQLFHSISVEELKRMNGVHPDRADILPAGTSILKGIFEFFPLKSCSVSTKGLRYGVIQSIQN